MEGIFMTYPSSCMDFDGLSSELLSSKLHLCNLTGENRLAFKVKSNAPRGTLVVRPNLGLLLPKQIQDILVTIHQSDPKNLKKNYKLKIQYIILTEGEVDLDWIWKNSSLIKIYNHKIDCSCTFKPESHERRLMGLKNTRVVPLNDKKVGNSSLMDFEDALTDFSNLPPNQIYIVIVIFVLGIILGKWIV
ncbi:vesicle-associated membrane protein-associated protein A [Lepeophtheirus salmonis]|uniref:Vesicle-associated membrane protein-associated protein A n=1 Tax=Lepeophtheirus salmonis TaxID=72036 RepID=D3PHP8_LEPSM|nr:uncharacterized protein LOC121129852 [Lepeophtheirus salmonis]ADD38084.1 Vesicle-associated membrane protein-associated protein A [Lepeophtheirus salmonis]